MQRRLAHCSCCCVGGTLKPDAPIWPHAKPNGSGDESEANIVPPTIGNAHLVGIRLGRSSTALLFVLCPSGHEVLQVSLYWQII